MVAGLERLLRMPEVKQLCPPSKQLLMLPLLTILNEPEVQQLDFKERENLVSGLNRLAAVDAKLADSWLLWLGTGLLSEGYAAAVGEYARAIGNFLDRPCYDFNAIGIPVLYATAAPQLPKRLGINGIPAVERYIQILFDAAEFAQQLEQQPEFFARFSSGFRIAGKPKRLRQVMGWFKSLYALDEQVAKDAASVIARLPPYDSLRETANDYLSTIATAVERFGSGHKIVRALLNPDKADEIAKIVQDYPGFPFAFGNSSAAPVCDAFWPDCGWTMDEEQAAARSEWDLLQSHHFDVETSLLAENLEDVVIRAGIKNRTLSMLDLGSGDGRKLALMVKELDKKGYNLANVCMVDVNWYSVLEAVLSIEANGRAVIAEGEGRMPLAAVISKFNYDGRERLKLTMLNERIEKLASSPAFVEFAHAHPSRLTTFQGTSFCNFPPDDICDYLKGISGGFALIGVYLHDGNDAALKQAYSDVKVRRLAENNLRLLGVSEQDIHTKFEFRVDINKERQVCRGTTLDPLVDVVAYFVAKQQVRSRLWDIEQNERIPGIHSIKYSDAQFRQLMASHSIAVEAAYAKEDVALYLVRTPAVVNR